MPIRFRCAYCSQLMGIARRKAGTVVSCPTCHGQVVVPNPAPEEQERAEKPLPGANGPKLFEGSDFDQVFAPSAPEPQAPVLAPPPMAPAPGPTFPAPPAVDAPAAPWVPTQAEISFDVERINSPLAPEMPAGVGRSGVWLSPTALTLLSLLLIVLLALAFVGGLLLGKSLGG